VSKSFENMKEKRALLEQELARLTEINLETLRMSETSVLCSEMKRTIQEYKRMIEELKFEIEAYEK